MLLLLLLKFADCTSWLCNAVALAEQNIFLDHACILFQWISYIICTWCIIYDLPMSPIPAPSTLCTISLPLRNTIISCFLQFDIWHFIPNIFWPIWSWAKEVHILNYSWSFLWNAMLANSNDEVKWMHVGGTSGKHSNSLNLRNSTNFFLKKTGSVDKWHFPNNSDLPCRGNLIGKGNWGCPPPWHQY